MFSRVSVRSFHASARSLKDAPAAATAAGLTINFCTPHAPIYKNKAVEKVMLPGEIGEYGITAGHSPLISQLKAGIVTVQHTDGNLEKFFVSGGFAITNANSVTDVSVGEAYPFADFDESSVKSTYAQALKDLASAADGSPEKGIATVQVNVLADLARALSIAL